MNEKTNESSVGSSGAEQHGGVVAVTPAMAQAWLTNMATNRRISSKRVKHYASIMAADNFHLNGETIKIDEHGQLIDGQHRCAAVVQYGKPVKIYVVYNVPRSAIVTIDMGRARSLADQLRVAYDYTNTGDLGTIIRLILEWNETGWISHATFRQVDPLEVHEYVVANPGATDLTKSAGALDHGAVNAIMKRNHCAFLMWLFSRIDPDDAKRFMHNLVNSIAEYENDPCVVLRKQLLRMRNDRFGHTKRNIVIGMTIQAWNKWRERKPAKLFRMPISTQPWDADSYPQPI
ncbi:ParB N-terminal domain-containing protein [Amycolatopsis japonica]|nr:hypothetical protein [Amycolatopsis japonica]